MSAGYVQSAMWHLVPTFVTLPVRADSWLQIPVPLGHIVMWSMLHIHDGIQHQTQLRVYVGGKTPSVLVWQGGDSVDPEPAVHNTSSVFVYFMQGDPRIFLSFRLIFSFHKVRILAFDYCVMSHRPSGHK